jgi:cullin 1
MLDKDYEEDMKRMYNLLSRIPNGLDLLSDFDTRLRKAGLASVAKAASESDKLEPKIYVGDVPNTQNQGPIDGAPHNKPKVTE